MGLSWEDGPGCPDPPPLPGRHHPSILQLKIIAKFKKSTLNTKIPTFHAFFYPEGVLF